MTFPCGLVRAATVLEGESIEKTVAVSDFARRAGRSGRGIVSLEALTDRRFYPPISGHRTGATPRGWT